MEHTSGHDGSVSPGSFPYFASYPKEGKGCSRHCQPHRHLSTSAHSLSPPPGTGLRRSRGVRTAPPLCGPHTGCPGGWTGRWGGFAHGGCCHHYHPLPHTTVTAAAPTPLSYDLSYVWLHGLLMDSTRAWQQPA